MESIGFGGVASPPEAAKASPLLAAGQNGTVNKASGFRGLGLSGLLGLLGFPGFLGLFKV